MSRSWPSRLARLPASRSTLAGALMVALSLPGAWIDLRAWLACWLAAWWFVMGLSLGGMCNLWIHRLSGGDWGHALRPPALAAARRLPLGLLLFLPVAAGLARLYPWAGDPSGHWAQHLAQPAFTRAWLHPAAFAVRAVLVAATWWWLSRPATLATPGRSAAALVLYLVSGSCAAVDLLMSLVPGWASTAFGLVALSAQATSGAALATLRVALADPSRLQRRAEPKSPPVGRDLGNLLLMWVMTWAYLAFMEFLIVWSENLPAEVRWFVPRVHGAWAVGGIVLALAGFGLPQVLLLLRPLKDRPERLAAVSALVLVTQLLQAAWLVLPSVAPGSALPAWALPLMAAGLGLLVLRPATRPGAPGDAPAARGHHDTSPGDAPGRPHGATS